MSVPSEVQRLLKFVNADGGIAGDEISIRRELRGWLDRLVSGQRLPAGVISAPYVLDAGAVAGDSRSTWDWFGYRRGLEWLATVGGELLRECPRCKKLFLTLQRSTRRFCPDCR